MILLFSKRCANGSSSALLHSLIISKFFDIGLGLYLPVKRDNFSLMRAAVALLLYIMAILCRYKLKSCLTLFSISLAGLNFFVEISTAISRE